MNRRFDMKMENTKMFLKDKELLRWYLRFEPTVDVLRFV